MWSPGAHSTHLNGPVPPTMLAAFGPSTTSLSCMRRNVIQSHTPGRGLSDVRMMVFLSGFSMLVHHALPGATTEAYGFLGSRTRRMLYSTSSLVNSRPEWNVTPLRRLSLTFVWSVLTSQLSARRGSGFRSSE